MEEMMGRVNKCINCGEVGSHFVPPSLGEEGFFLCEKKGEDMKDKQKTANETP